MSSEMAILADVPMFALIDDQERQTLAELLDTCHFATGETIFSQGDAGDTVYIVRQGRVQTFITSDEGETIVVGENENGDVFGEISLLDGGPRTASAVAVEETDCFSLDREKLLQLVQKHPHTAIDLLTVMGRRLRATDEMLRTRVTRNVNLEEEEMMTFGQRIADHVASFGGSWTFIISCGVVLVGWILVNVVVLASHPFDPYPFILLNLVLSMMAAIQAPVIMMSQNRQAAKDRLKADMDYEVNLKAELEVAQLHRKIDKLYEDVQARLVRLDKRP